MIIKNISGEDMFFGWIGTGGAWIIDNATKEVPDDLAFTTGFKNAKDNAYIEVVSYDESVESHVVQEELQSVVRESELVVNVGPTREITTPAEAFALADKTYFKGGLKVLLDPGVYSVASLAKIDKVTVLGDTARSLAGYHWKNGLDNSYWPPANAGAGTITITNAGNEIIVTCVTTNPDFVAGGIVAGDKVVAKDNAGIVTEYEIADAIDNRLILTTTAPNMTGDTGFFIAPNVQITGLSFNGCETVTVEGIYIKDNSFSIQNSNTVNLDRICVFNGPSTKFVIFRYNKYIYGGYFSFGGRQTTTIEYCDYVYLYDVLYLDNETSAWPIIKCNHNQYVSIDWLDILGKVGATKVGVNCEYTSWLYLGYGFRSKNIAYHLFLQGVKNAYTWGSFLDAGAYGVWASGSKIYTDAPQTVQNQSSFGFRADDKALIIVAGATLSGNGADYSPAVSGAEGNNDAIIVHP